MLNEFMKIDLRCPSYFSHNSYFVEKQIIKLKKGGSTLGEIRATLFELELLKILAIHRVLSREHLLRLHNLHYPITPATLKRKLDRWSKKGVVSISSPSKKYHNTYSIGEVGLQLLVDNNYLPKDCLAENVSDYTKGVNYTHTIGQQEMAINIFCGLYEDGLFLSSIRPQKYITQEVKSKYGMPDWLLKYNPDNGEKPTHLYLEFDTGSERGDSIYGKFDQYIKRANEIPDERVVVLISLMDEKFHYRGVKNSKGIKRIANLKQYFFDKDKVLPNNLSVKITFLNRTVNVVRDELLPHNKEKVILSFKSYFEKIMGYDVREVANEDVYSREIAETAYADKLFQLLHKDQLHERVAVIVAKEGDINSAQRVLDFYQVMKDRLFKRSVSKLVIIYPDEDSIHYDTYNCHFDKSVLITDCESLTESRKVIFNQYINMNSTKIRGYLLNN